MHSKKLFQELVKLELPPFERVFKALPKDKMDWRAHPKNKSAKELVLQMGMEPAMILDLLKKRTVDFAKLPKPKSVAEAIKIFSRDFKKLSAAAAKVSDKDWVSAKASMGEWQEKLGLMVTQFVMDLVHHRGQLSTYIRPMGGKVPAIYGPSGDSK